MPRGGWCRRRVVPVNGVSEIHSWPLWGDPVVNVLHAAVQVAVPPHIHDCKDLQLKARKGMIIKNNLLMIKPLGRFQ